MYSQQQFPPSHSPPPLQHPVPTHPAFIPDPPSTPASPQGYMRFTSSPPANQQQSATWSQQPRPQSRDHFPQNAAYPQPPQFQGFSPNAHHGQQQPGIDFAQWGVNPTTAQFGMQLGSSAVAAGQEYVTRNVCDIVLFFLISQGTNTLV